MQLEDIAKRYRDNLRSFFSDETVIEQIYKEQYGKENYTANSGAYKEQYRYILDNTVFVPYITIEHLQQFLGQMSFKYGKEYLKRFGEEEKLYTRLDAKRSSIIEQYTSQLFAELDKMMPGNTITNKKIRSK